MTANDMNNIKMDLIPFQEGRIACVKGQICRIFGMMIGSFLKENPARLIPEVVTYRVPLKDEERFPMNPLSSIGSTRLDLVVSADPKRITLEEFYKMIDSVQYYHEIENHADALRTTVRALKEKGVSGYMPGSTWFFLKFDSSQDGNFYIEGYHIKKEELLLVLADIQRFSTQIVLLSPQRDDDNLSVVCDSLQGYMKGMCNRGLWRGEKDGKNFFFVENRMFENDWMDATRISFEDFKSRYENVTCVIPRI